jgi:4-hydroxy-2-oxoheptanedioate aldolase
VNLQRANLLEAGSKEWADALDDIVIVLMIEKREAIQQIDQILAVPGVDMVQFGPADYANSIGRTGEFQHPEVVAAEQLVIERAKEHGVAARVELNDASDADRYLDIGVKHFNIGFDVRTLFDWYCREGSVMQQRLSKLIATE